MRKSVFFSFLFIIPAIFYFIWLSPLMSDNFVFSRQITPGYAQFYTGCAIDAKPLTLAGAFDQAREMYFTWCGRFAGNLMVHLLFMLPHWLYSLLAACAFGLYVWILQMCVFGRHWRQNLTWGWILGIAALLWLAMPSFGEAFFWLSVGGQIALLGQAAVLLPFRFALDGLPRMPLSLASFCKSLLFMIACAFVASLDYPASAVLPPAAILCLIWLLIKNTYRRSISACRFFFRHCLMLASGAIGLCIGAFFTLAAPGNAERLRLSQDPAVKQYMAASWPERILDWLADLPGFLALEAIPFFIMAFSLLALAKERHWPWPKLEAAGLFLLPCLLAPASFLFTAWPPPRAFAGSAAFALVCACILLACAMPALTPGMGKALRWLKILLALCVSASLLWEGVKFYNLHELMATREKILLAAKDSASLPPLPPGSGDKYWVLGKYQHDLSTDPDFWVNRAMGAHYGLREVKAQGGANTVWEMEAPKPVGRIAAHVENDVISARMARSHPGAPASLHYYYFGEPALLCLLPYGIGKSIFDWLASPGGDGLKKLLLPILLARTDIRLNDDAFGGKEGQSPRLKLYSDEKFWIVRPGLGPASLDLMPLRKMEPISKEAGKN